jgi:protocatechuate 3,4-dioxygenase beta subunit
MDHDGMKPLAQGKVAIWQSCPGFAVAIGDSRCLILTMEPNAIVFPRVWTRRKALATFAATFAAPGAFAEALTQTPRQTEGPFYPDKLPLDTDNDLLILNDSLTPAIGEVTYLSGRLLDASGAPIRNATVEIWQVDGRGVYLHSGSGSGEKRDANFQGFGRFLTGADGGYRFRTVKPVPYPGRTPHIHFAVKMKGREKWTTQCYVKGHPGNQRDGVLRGIKDDKARESLLVDFAPIKDAKAGELGATFDIVMGFTPADDH